MICIYIYKNIFVYLFIEVERVIWSAEKMEQNNLDGSAFAIVML